MNQMPKITNHYRSPVAVAGVTIPKGEARDIESWNDIKDRPVIKRWLDKKVISTGDHAKKPADEGGGVNLDDMTVAEMRDYAESRNIELGDATRKDDIRAAIDLAEQS
jgi:hypothetical protein